MEPDPFMHIHLYEQESSARSPIVPSSARRGRHGRSVARPAPTLAGRKRTRNRHERRVPAAHTS